MSNQLVSILETNKIKKLKNKSSYLKKQTCSKSGFQAEIKINRSLPPILCFLIHCNTK